MAALNRRALDKLRAQELEEAPSVTPPARVRAEGIMNAVVPQNDVDGYTREITRLWGEARDKFLAIGEYLMHAKRTLAHGEYEMMIRSRLPFNTSAAHKMRAVAEAIHEGRIPRAKLPHSYATAYELTLLSEQEFQVAVSRGLVRPDVYLREIQALRAELRAPMGPQKRAALARERERLAREYERIRSRMEEIDRELAGAKDDGVIIEGTAESEVSVASEEASAR
jgi:hypothetical protein